VIFPGERTDRKYISPYLTRTYNIFQAVFLIIM